MAEKKEHSNIGPDESISKKLTKLEEGLTYAIPELFEELLGFMCDRFYDSRELDPSLKQIIAITALSISGHSEQLLLDQLRKAINMGISKEKLTGVFMHIARYAGFPVSIRGVHMINEIIGEDSLAGK